MNRKESQEKIKVICSNQECLYEWAYGGKSKWYASCPRCHSNIRIRNLIK